MGKVSRKKKKDKQKSQTIKIAPEAAPSASGTGFFLSTSLHVVIIVIIAIFAYANSLDVPFQFDDAPNIEHNLIIRDLGHFSDPSSAEGMQFYGAVRRRFVGYLTFALNYAVNGLDVTGYHVVNLTIHIINALFVYLLVLLTFRTPVMKGSGQDDSYTSLIALFASLLFAAHPIQTQAVTYIVQRFASLATLFYLGSLLSYVRFRLAGRPREGLVYYALSIGMAILGMNTKEIVFTLPVMIGVYEAMFFSGELKKRALVLVPFALPMVLVPLMLVGAKESFGEILTGLTQSTKVQTEMSRSDYLFTEFRVIMTYIRLLFLPVNQNLDYDYPEYHSLFVPAVFVSFVIIISMLGWAGYRLYRNIKEKKAEPWQMLLSFGILWFFITLSVESSVIPIIDVVFEHRVYLPSFGAFAAMGGVVLWVVQKRPTMAKKVMVVCGVVIVVLAGATHTRNKVWQSELSLWEDVVKKSPNKARGYYNVGVEYNELGRRKDAIHVYEKAIALKPDYADAHFNLGLIYNNMGLFDKALSYYEKAIQYDPELYKSYYSIGHIRYEQERYREALDFLKKSIEKKSNHAPSYTMIGLSYYNLGKYDLALENFDKAISLDPNEYKAHNNRGMIYANRREYEKALDEFSTTIRMSPDNGQVFQNRALVYRLMRKTDLARKDFLEACRLGIKTACSQVEN